MDNWLQAVYDRIEEHFYNEHLPGTLELVRQPSIAGTGEGIAECAGMVAAILEDLGCRDVHLEHYVHSPIVSGKLMSSNPDAPTLVMYGMYDVQPPEPLDEWRVPPFAGVIEEVPGIGECVVSRGIANSKGPLMCFIHAVKEIKHVLGDLPLNIWFIVEGEEEMGSESMVPFTGRHANELSQCLGVFLNAARQDEKGRPFTTLGNKGILYLDLECRGGDWGGPIEIDLHSKEAAWVSSPVWRLVNALNTLRDAEDNILIEGFYDQVVLPSAVNQQLTEDMLGVFDEQMYLQERLKAKRFMKEMNGADALFSWLWKPTLNIDGIQAGYNGPATKTVLPYRATCKIDVRLVPNMTAEQTYKNIRRHFDKHGYSDIEILRRQGTPWSLVDAESLAARACIAAMNDSGYKDTAIWPNFPGSGPAYVFTDPPVSIPFVDYGLGISGRIHAPNEYFTVQGLKENEMSCTAFLYHLCRLWHEELQG
jgi:acetylornithine deacetylase/succinyl-diaminopimelate desuccinylase-like protein